MIIDVNEASKDIYPIPCAKPALQPVSIYASIQPDFITLFDYYVLPISHCAPITFNNSMYKVLHDHFNIDMCRTLIRELCENIKKRLDTHTHYQLGPI